MAASRPASGRQSPEAQAEGLRQQRVGVGADGVEGDVAEVEQAGEADHDVQAPAEHDVDQHGGRDVDHVAVGERQERQDEGEDEARSREATRSGADGAADLGQAAAAHHAVNAPRGRAAGA